MDPIMALLIVSCQIFQLQASLEAPQLTVTPRSLHYVTGQSVTLACSLAEYQKAKRFTFFKDKIELSSSEWTRNQRESYHISQLRISDSGEYSCQYCTTSSDKQPIHCLESDPARITVLEQPHRPSFSVSPKQEIYTSWEFINLTCSVSDTRNVSRVQFLKTKRQLAFLEPASSPFTHSLQLLPQEDGNYSCKYWVVDLDWEIPSQESNIISISVTDPPPLPVLKLDPPTGEVNEGNLLLITCSTDKNNTEKRFHFYRDGVEMTPADEGLLWCPREAGNASTEASVAILQARPNQTGGFACSYEEKIKDRWVSSHWSQKVTIVVLLEPEVWAQHPYSVLEHARWAIPLLIAMVPLVFCCRERASKYRKKSKPAKGAEATGLGKHGTVELQATTF